MNTRLNEHSAKNKIAILAMAFFLFCSVDCHAQTSPVTIKNTVPHGTIAITAAL